MLFCCNKFWFPNFGLGSPKNTIKVPPEEGERVGTNVILHCVFSRVFNKVAELKSAFYTGIHVLFVLQSVPSFLMWMFFQFISPIMFSFMSEISVWHLGIHTCYAPSVVSNIHQSFLLKLIHNSFSNALCWWFVHVLLFHQAIIIWLWLNGYLASMLKSPA